MTALHLHSALGAALFVVSLGSVGCTPKTGEPAKLIDIINKPDSMDGKYVTTEGLIRLSTGFVGSTKCDNRACTINLDLADGEKADPEHSSSLSIEVEKGSGENEMAELPAKYSSSDLKVKAMGGKTLNHGDRAKVSGKLRCHSGCTMGVERIDVP